MPALQTEVLITAGSAELGRHALDPGEYILGRDPECHIRIEADLVAHRHARLTLTAGHALIEDLGGSGTLVNGEPVAGSTRLAPGAKIRIGAATVELRNLCAESGVATMLIPAAEFGRSVAPEEFLRGRKYEIGGVVAKGAMGAILDATEATTGRTVAMKVMLDSTSPADRQRFLTEAKITAQLEHPSIVPVYELSLDENGQIFYTMQFVKGVTLRKVLEQLADGDAATLKKYPLPALLTIFQKVCDALAFAHSKGIIHRDLKPENIMLGDFGSVLVMDWGLAKRLKDEGGSMKDGASPAAEPKPAAQSGHVPSSFDIHPSSLGATLQGTVMGTPQYMAPEQARGEVDTLDHRADIYALGAILYHLLARRPAVTGETAMDVVAKVARGEFARLPSAGYPDSLIAVIHKAMAFDRNQRYANVADLQSDLAAYQGGFATSAERAGLARQIFLAVMRHKVTTVAAIITLIAGIGFGTQAILEGKRAERGEALAQREAAHAKTEAKRAEDALADLKASAPALLQLAESEADAQRFPSALGKLDAALALDPALLRARWQRAWVLLGLEKWSDAADALRLAKQHDPKEEGVWIKDEGGGMKDEDPDRAASSFIPHPSSFSSLLPAVEKVAAAPEAGRWKSDAAREVFDHLQTVEATGPALAFSGKLKLGAAERLKLADERLLATLGKGNYTITIENDGFVAVGVSHKPLVSLEGIRGLPIEKLNAGATRITDLEPLRGMHLQILAVNNSGVTDLTPLRGMSLRSLEITQTRVRDLSPLSGMRLSIFKAFGCSNVADLTPLAGMPLTTVQIGGTKVSRIEALRGAPIVTLNMDGSSVVDCSPLKGAPLKVLTMGSCKVSDLSFASGMPLRSLNIPATLISSIDALRGLPLESLELRSTSVSDLSPLQGAPLKDLDIRDCKQLTDYTPVLTLPRLERLLCDVLPAALLPLRESKTLKVIEAKAYPGEGSQGARPVAEFWRAYEAWKAKQK